MTSSAPPNAHEVLNQWMHITSRPDESFAHKLEHLLELLRVHMNLDVGIVSRVDGAHYDVLAVSAPGFGLAAGTRFDLAATYCERTVTRRYVTSFHHAAQDRQWCTHPAYAAFALEAYIGVSIQVGEACFGTLNFSSTLPRMEPFSVEHHQLVKLTSQWLGRELGRTHREERAQHEVLMLRQSVASARDHAMRSSQVQQHILKRLFQDLHMPLRGIASLSMQLVEHDQLEANPFRHRLEAIHTSSTHLLSVVKQVLDTSSLQEIHHMPRAERFSLHTVLEEAATLLAPLAHQRGLYLDICLEATLPDEVCGDPVRLRQILMNLLGDAITRTESGGVFLRCCMDDWERGGEHALMCIDIQDTSLEPSAIRPEDSLATSHSRKSIGVEIARELVEMMSGQLDEHAHGSRGFERRIALPFKLAQASTSVPLTLATTTWISCIHDSFLMGLETSCARYGAQLVSRIEDAQVCLVDSAQPEVTSLVEQIRSHQPDARIYLFARPDCRAEFAHLKVDAVLDKPLRQRQLVELFRQAAPPHQITQHMTMTTTLSMELQVDDLELGEWLLPPTFGELELSTDSALPDRPQLTPPLARATLPDVLSTPHTMPLPAMSTPPAEEELPVLDASIYEAFASHHDDAAFLRELTQEFFAQGARLLSLLLRDQASMACSSAQIADQIDDMQGTATCLGLWRVSAQCRRILDHIAANPDDGGGLSVHIKVLGEHLNEALEATQARLKAERRAS